MLDLNHVSMTFNPGTVNEKKALTDINLHMESGEFATIVGSNGAGKSTLFNAIAGSFIPDTGSILLDGVDMTFQPDFRRSKAIGRLFQDPLKGTAPNMTIEENLALAYLRASTHTSPFSRITKADRELFTDRLVQLGLGLENRMKQPVGLLSGGQRQALTLLMATLVTPKLLLLDEHTAALDPATADKVLELTKKIVAENHITCLMITHNMHAALELGNRTLMMDSGHIVLDISGEERANTTVDGLLDQFAKNVGRRLDNDRILLSRQEETAQENNNKMQPPRGLLFVIYNQGKNQPAIAPKAEMPKVLSTPIMQPASRTPPMQARTLSLKSISSRLAARVPVHAPVPGRGMPTNSSRAIKRPRPAVAFSFWPPLWPFSRQKVKNLPITGLSAPHSRILRANKKMNGTGIMLPMMAMM